MHIPRRSRGGTSPSERSRAFRRSAGSLAALATAAGLLTACGGSSGTPNLIWYINPDIGGQDAVAKNCSTSDYTITTQVLPQDSSQQRVQLARRLAAHDSGIDLMSLDPPFTAEFANAGFLAPIPQDMQSQLSSSRSRAPTRLLRGTTSSWCSRSGPTPRCCGTASPSSTRPAST